MPKLIFFLLFALSISHLQAQLAINEFMASNDSTVMDVAGQYDDWIEIYNYSSKSLDISGFYLSDDPENITKWSFPENTIIESETYLIVWADEDGDQMQAGFHANFKLSKNGESILLSTKNETVIDEVNFGPQETDLASARIPNGTGDFVIQAHTFKANNEGVTSNFDLAKRILKIYPNPANQFINLEFDKKMDENVYILNILGQVQSQIKVNGTEIKIPLRNFEEGQYILQSKNKTLGKFVVIH